MLSLVIAVVAAQVEIDQLMRTAGDERAPRVMALCRPGSAWWAANESNANALASCEAALRAFATEAHEAAQRDRDRARYLEAKRRYRAYLDAFGPGPHLSDEAFNVTFYLAEVLWSLESWEEAIAQYEAVARFQLPDRDSARLAAHPRYRELADYDLVLACGKLVARERGRPGSRASGDDQKEGPPIGARRTPLSRFEAKLVQSADDYLLRHDDAAGAEVALEAALVFAERGHVTEALARLQALVRRWPGERSAREAAAMIARLQQPKR